jgi:hypothetical protein
LPSIFFKKKSLNIFHHPIVKVFIEKKALYTCNPHREEVDVMGVAKDTFAEHVERAMDVSQENFLAISERTPS